MSLITTHVLDAALGLPAAGVPVALITGTGVMLAGAVTNDDGRVPELGPDTLDAGVYSLVFDTATYFAATNRDSFYPWITIDFNVGDAAHYHVPLLLSPFSYSTYRGS